MKATVGAALLVVAGLSLAACSGAGAGAQTQSTAAGGETSSSGTAAELTDTTRLMLGTMKLDEVGLQPDANEAGQLLTLWQAYRSVVTSDTAAPAEADAVLKQIRSTMAPEQLDAIAAMDLTQDDLRNFMEEFRQTAAQNGGGSVNGFTPGQGPDGGPGPGFVPPDGGRVFGGDGFAGGGGFTPEQRATAEARRSTGTNAGGSGLFLLRPLIAELQTLAGS